MPCNTADIIMKKIEALAADPFAPSSNVKKLTSHPGYRLRIGDWRVVYTIQQDRLLIAVVRIVPRGEAYR